MTRAHVGALAYARDAAPPVDLSALRVLIAHDWLVAWAGSERCVEQLLQVFPQADLVVGVLAASMRNFNEVARRARETWLGRIPGARTHHRWFLPLEGLAFATLDTRGYDLVISSSHAFSKSVRVHEDTVHLCYCYSPPRYLWDLYETYRFGAGWWERSVLTAVAEPLRCWDRFTAKGVSDFVAISQHVAERIRRVYRRNAEVVYPPVARRSTVGSSDPGLGRYALYLGRLVAYKRVDLAIQAAERVGVTLVVAGDGPERTKLERSAGKHVRFVGEVSEQGAEQLLDHCAAFVFCAEDDFGIAPVEANAHGKPVVGYAAGGLAETMVPDATATLFSEQRADAVADALERTLCRQWDSRLLQANAERFRPAAFREGIRAAVARSLTATDEPVASAVRSDLSGLLNLSGTQSVVGR